MKLACGNWSYFLDPSWENLKRMGHSIIVRNKTLVITGGTNGFLLNDMIQINLPSLPAIESNICTTCPNSVINRDTCRGILIILL